jgi:hypothetical protein
LKKLDGLELELLFELMYQNWNYFGLDELELLRIRGIGMTMD